MRPTPLAALAAVLAALACAPAPTAARPDAAARWGPWSVELVDEGGAVLPTFEHRGRTYVLGTRGRRYAVRIRNPSGGRVEVILSVDGRDAIDGRPSSFGKRGYVVDPWSEVVVDGFRLSDASVAAFRFGSVSASYAARMGDARDVGAIGVAVFAEAPPSIPPPRPYAHRAAEDAAPSAAPGSAQPSGGAAAEPRARSEAKRAPAPDGQRPGLGTEFGEERESAVARVSFERARPEPEALLTVRYDDRAGLLALGIDVDGSAWARRDEAWRRAHADPFRRDASYALPPPGWRP